jgi:hypothetical protein
MDTEKRNIAPIIEQEENHLPKILSDEDLKDFKLMVGELRDTWTKKQMYRTETEMRFSVLNDLVYPTKAAKYWQAVREQNSFLGSLMSVSFEARRNDVEIEQLKKKIETEKDPLEKELHQIDLDQKVYKKASLELDAKDRMRELRLWSQIKKELDDGSFDTKDVNTHQLDSYHKQYQHKLEHLTPGSSQAEVTNVVGQLKSIERIKKDGRIGYNEPKAISSNEKK